MPSPSTRRKLLAWIAVALGLVLVVAGVAEFAIANRAESLADLVRPELTDEGLEQHRADFETASRTLTAVRDDIIPDVASQLGIPPAVVVAGLALQYPDVARVLSEQDEMESFAEASLTNLERQQERFESADSLPASWLPAWAGAAMAIVLGLAVIATGALMARQAARWTAGTVVIAGAAVLLIVLPLAMRVPWKTADAEAVLDSLNPSDAIAQQTEDYVELTRAGLTQFEEELLPGVAEILDISEEELDAEIASRYPEFSADLAAMPAVLDRYEARAQIRTEGAAELRFFQDLPLALLGWFGPAFGAVLLGFAAVAWWARGREADYLPDPGTDDAPSPV